MNTPSPNGGNGRGRDTGGRFAKGNGGGPGNPHAAHVGRLRSALLEAVTEKDMKAIVAKLVQMACKGDVAACREILNRTLGRPQEADIHDRLEALEQAVAEQANHAV